MAPNCMNWSCWLQSSWHEVRCDEKCWNTMNKQDHLWSVIRLYLLTHVWQLNSNGKHLFWHYSSLVGETLNIARNLGELMTTKDFVTHTTCVSIASTNLKNTTEISPIGYSYPISIDWYWGGAISETALCRLSLVRFFDKRLWVRKSSVQKFIWKTFFCRMFNV